MRSIGYTSRLVSAPGAANSGDMPNVSAPEGHARGIVIDNPSGSWLSVSSLYDLVPPYTLQWSRDLPVGAASVTIRYVNGPAGQVSTQQGDPFTVWLDTEMVGASNGVTAPGSAFITGFTPVLTAYTQASCRTFGPGGNVSLIAPIPNKRIRLHTVSVQHGIPDNSQGLQQMAGISVGVFDTTIVPATLAILNVSPSAPFALAALGGLDVALGAGVDINASSWWPIDGYVNVNATYSVI